MMAAGVTDRLWDMTDLVEMIEAWEAKEKRDAGSGYASQQCADAGLSLRDGR